MWKTNYLNFSEFLTRIGVARNDVLMVHSFVPSLGQLEDGLEGIYQAFRERLGPGGTLVVPTFTYSFCRNEEFDLRRSPSTVGSFTEFVRCQEGTVRSADPIFSIAAIGKEAAEITTIRAPVCFGIGSVFELLEQYGVKFLLIGIDYQKSLTYFIHLEKLFGVHYREDKLFHGLIVDSDGSTRQATFSYFVRTERSGVRMDYNRMGYQFDETSPCRKLEFAYGVHRLFSGQGLKSYVFDRLTEDPYCLARSSDQAHVGKAADPYY